MAGFGVMPARTTSITLSTSGVRMPMSASGAAAGASMTTRSNCDRSESSIRLDAGKVKLTQKTHYPWHGEVEIKVQPDKPFAFDLHLRIPGWCESGWSVEVNGKAVPDKPGELAKVFEDIKPGTSFDAVVLRKTKKETVNMALREVVRREAAVRFLDSARSGVFGAPDGGEPG